MALQLVIDGYNVIRADSGEADYPLNDLEASRNRLIERMKVYRRHKRVKVTIVFDGIHSGRLGDKQNHAGIGVTFSRSGEDADTVIKELCRARGSSLTVVTTDHDLGSYAEANGAVVIKSSEFLELLEMVEYQDIKGVEMDDEEDEEPTFGKKKGPAKRQPRQERKKRNRIKKL
ncbi:MAG: NYN domain-containing protein [Thermodesulfobacteriota bacterium]